MAEMDDNRFKDITPLITKFVVNRQLLYAIKEYRTIMGTGLRDAKELIEAYAIEIGVAQEEQRTCHACNGKGTFTSFAWKDLGSANQYTG